MNSTDQKSEKLNDEDRKKRLDELLHMIGGMEESIRFAQEQKDWDFLRVLRELKPKYYERLRRVAYGFPEERRVPTEKES